MGGKQSNWATGMGVNCIMANELTTPMEPSGRVLPLFRGEYSDSIVYENPDIVLYENSSYVAKQITIGNPPPKNVSSNDYWQMVAKGIIDADVSDSTIEFTEASERINIKSGEKSNIIMGKIMKFFTDLKDVAFSGSYVDLSNKPTIPASAKNGKLTIQKNGTEVQTFTANQSTNAVANILVPTISNSAAVTQTGQMALDAVEKNAAVPGTLANQISQANSNFKNYLPAYFEYVGSAEGIGNSLDIPRGAKELYIIGNTPYYSIPIFLTAGQLTLYESVLGGGNHYIRFSVNRNGSGKIVITDAMQDGSTSNNARIALWYR